MFSGLRTVVLRLFVYYLIYLSIWKCPPGSDLDESPALCTPLHSVFDVLNPYVAPFYHEHVEHRVRALEPWAASASNVYIAFVKPSVDRVSSHVEILLSPYVEKASAFHASKVSPHLSRAQDTLQKSVYDPVASGYSAYVLPAGQKAAPLIGRAATNSRHVVWPKLETSYKAFVAKSQEYSQNCWIWVSKALVPKVYALYSKYIEPQVTKVQERLTESHSSVSVSASASVSVSASASASASASTSSSTSTSSITSTTSTTTSTSTSTSTSASASVSVPVSVSDELEYWSSVVDRTTRAAMSNFLDDVQQLKNSRVDEARPKFTEYLRKLQQVQTAAIADLNQLVASLQRELGDEDGYQSDVTPSQIQNTFKEFTEDIRVASLKVRTLSQELANEILVDVEEARSTTIEVLDEFSEVALHEIGHKLVTVEGDHSEKGPRWKDWKSYRALKEKLAKCRAEIQEINVNMADVNLVLREAQETATILAKETIDYMSGLRGKADYLLHQKILATRDSKPEPEDPEVEVYEDLEETSGSENYQSEDSQYENDQDYQSEDDEYENETITQTIVETKTLL